MKSFAIGVILKAVDNVTGPVKQMVGKSSAIMATGFKRANQQLTSGLAVQRDLSIVGDTATRVAQTIGASLGAAINVGKEYEASLSRLRSASQATEQQMKLMGIAARKFGPSFGYSASEAADGMVELSKAGLTALQTTQALPGLLALSKAGYLDVSEAATIGADAMSSFGLQAKDFGRISDVMVNAADASTIGVADLAETFKYASAAAKIAGASLEETAAMTALLGSVGIKGSMAGTAMKGMYTDVADPKKLKIFKSLGVSTMDKKGNLRDMPSILAGLSKAMEKLKFGSGQRIALMNAIFGERGAPAAINLIDMGSAKISKMADQVSKAGTAARKSRELLNNFEGSQKKMNAAIDEMKLTVYEAMLPTLMKLSVFATKLVDKISKWAKENPALVKGLVMTAAALAAIAAVVGPILVLIATVGALKGAFGAGLTLFKKFGKVLFMFKSFFINLIVAVISGIRALSIALISTPVGWVILAIMAIAGAVYLIIKYWKPIKSFFVRLWAGIVSIFKTAWAAIMNALDNKWIAGLMLAFMPMVAMPLMIIKHWTVIKAFFIQLGSAIKSIWRGVIGAITSWWTSAVNAITGWVDKYPWLKKALNFISGGRLTTPKPSGEMSGAVDFSTTKTERSEITVNFANAPKGTRINTSGAPKNLNLNMGYNNASH